VINLFPKRVARNIERAPEVQSIESTPAMLPSVMMNSVPIDEHRVWSTERDFNLIRVVTDHGPARIAQITERLERMATEIQRLEQERTALQRLIAAVTEDDR
jgi:hypothetical protein